MATTLEWFGTATFRVRDAGLDLFFDAYLDRLPGLPPVGLSTAAVGKADYVFISHAHFDHLYGAEAVARGTGATIVASPESVRCLRESGVPDEQLLMVTGGETVHCGPNDPRQGAAGAALVPVRPQRARHLGRLPGRPRGQRAAARRQATAMFGSMDRLNEEPVGRALLEMNGATSRHDGGQLAFLLMTSGGSMLVSGSAGYWRGIFDGLRPDVALLSLGGRPNVDGEPFQGSSVQYMLEQVQLLRPGRVAFCHHDPLYPGFPGVDIEPAADALQVPGAPTDYFGLEYATPVPLFG